MWGGRGETPGKLMEWQIGIAMMFGFLSVYIAFWRDRLTERKEGASIEKESRYQAKKKKKEINQVNFTGPHNSNSVDANKALSNELFFFSSSSSPQS